MAAAAAASDLVPVSFVWDHGGDCVYVDVTHCAQGTSRTVPLAREGQPHEGLFGTVINLEEGRHEYRFAVDGKWTFDQDLPAVKNESGHYSNMVQVEKQSVSTRLIATKFPTKNNQESMASNKENGDENRLPRNVAISDKHTNPSLQAPVKNDQQASKSKCELSETVGGQGAEENCSSVQSVQNDKKPQSAVSGKEDFYIICLTEVKTKQVDFDVINIPRLSHYNSFGELLLLETCVGKGVQEPEIPDLEQTGCESLFLTELDNMSIDLEDKFETPKREHIDSTVRSNDQAAKDCSLKMSNEPGWRKSTITVDEIDSENKHCDLMKNAHVVVAKDAGQKSENIHCPVLSSKEKGNGDVVLEVVKRGANFTGFASSKSSEDADSKALLDPDSDSEEDCSGDASETNVVVGQLQINRQGIDINICKSSNMLPNSHGMSQIHYGAAHLLSEDVSKAIHKCTLNSPNIKEEVKYKDNEAISMQSISSDAQTLDKPGYFKAQEKEKCSSVIVEEIAASKVENPEDQLCSKKNVSYIPEKGHFGAETIGEVAKQPENQNPVFGASQAINGTNMQMVKDTELRSPSDQPLLVDDEIHDAQAMHPIFQNESNCTIQFDGKANEGTIMTDQRTKINKEAINALSQNEECNCETHEVLQVDKDIIKQSANHTNLQHNQALLENDEEVVEKGTALRHLTDHVFVVDKEADEELSANTDLQNLPDQSVEVGEEGNEKFVKNATFRPTDKIVQVVKEISEEMTRHPVHLAFQQLDQEQLEEPYKHCDDLKVEGSALKFGKEVILEIERIDIIKHTYLFNPSESGEASEDIVKLVHCDNSDKDKPNTRPEVETDRRETENQIVSPVPMSSPDARVLEMIEVKQVKETDTENRMQQSDKLTENTKLFSNEEDNYQTTKIIKAGDEQLDTLDSVLPAPSKCEETVSQKALDVFDPCTLNKTRQPSSNFDKGQRCEEKEGDFSEVNNEVSETKLNAIVNRAESYVSAQEDYTANQEALVNIQTSDNLTLESATTRDGNNNRGDLCQKYGSSVPTSKTNTLGNTYIPEKHYLSKARDVFTDVRRQLGTIQRSKSQSEVRVQQKLQKSASTSRFLHDIHSKKATRPLVKTPESMCSQSETKLPNSQNHQKLQEAKIEYPAAVTVDSRENTEKSKASNQILPEKMPEIKKMDEIFDPIRTCDMKHLDTDEDGCTGVYFETGDYSVTGVNQAVKLKPIALKRHTMDKKESDRTGVNRKPQSDFLTAGKPVGYPKSQPGKNQACISPSLDLNNQSMKPKGNVGETPIMNVSQRSKELEQIFEQEPLSLPDTNHKGAKDNISDYAVQGNTSGKQHILQFEADKCDSSTKSAEVSPVVNMSQYPQVNTDISSLNNSEVSQVNTEVLILNQPEYHVNTDGSKINQSESPHVSLQSTPSPTTTSEEIHSENKLPVQIGINGFELTGRLFLLAALQAGLDVRAINEPFLTIKHMVYLLKQDSLRKHSQTAEDEIQNTSNRSLIVKGKTIQVSQVKENESIPWERMDVNCVVEANFRVPLAEARKHFHASNTEMSNSNILLNRNNPAKCRPYLNCHRVVIAGSSPDAPLQAVGATAPSHTNINQVQSHVSAPASALLPILCHIHKTFGLKYFTYTLLKSTRNSITSHSISCPTSGPVSCSGQTGRWDYAENLIIPGRDHDLQEELCRVAPFLHECLGAGTCVLVPTPDVSMVELILQVSRSDPTIYQSVCQSLKIASDEPGLQRVLRLHCTSGASGESRVPGSGATASSLFAGGPHSCVVDVEAGARVAKDVVKLVVWFDNHMGLVHRIVDMLRPV